MIASRGSLGALLLLLAGGILGYGVFGDSIARYTRPIVGRARSAAPGWFTFRTAVPLLIAVLLAALMRIPLISGYIILIGLLTLWRSYNKAKIAELTKLNKQVSRLVFAFRSVYKIQPVVFATLPEVIRRLDEPLKGWIDAALQAYRITDSAEEAYNVLRVKSDNHYLNQFVYVLEMSGSASKETVIDALDKLAQRLRRHEDLQRETEVELSSITGQTRMIQGIGLIVLLMVAVVPSLRGIYEKYVAAQILYLVFASIAVATSFVIDRRVDQLKESAL